MWHVYAKCGIQQIIETNLSIGVFVIFIFGIDEILDLCVLLYPNETIFHEWQNLFTLIQYNWLIFQSFVFGRNDESFITVASSVQSSTFNSYD